MLLLVFSQLLFCSLRASDDETFEMVFTSEGAGSPVVTTVTSDELGLNDDTCQEVKKTSDVVDLGSEMKGLEDVKGPAIQKTNLNGKPVVISRDGVSAIDNEEDGVVIVTEDTSGYLSPKIQSTQKDDGCLGSCLECLRIFGLWPDNKPKLS